MASQEHKKVICLVHFNPAEWYPPFMTVMRFLETKKEFKFISAFTTRPSTGSYQFQSASDNVKLFRFGVTGPDLSKLKRILTYLNFNISVLLALIKRRPETIIYYETISCFAPIIYKRFFSKNVVLKVHYHEYMSKSEYENGMILVKMFHKLECINYPVINTISHTNQKRMDLFMADNPGIKFNSASVLPNYPLREWTSPKVRNRLKPAQVRLVYVGTLNFEGLYLKEVIEWVLKGHKKYTLDIFSILIPDDVKAYLESCDPELIRYCGAVSFQELPSKLVNYDVGLVLYKGTTKNWQYNIPNKVFEYHRVGLDVWCPTDVLEVETIKTIGTYPAIKTIDFTKLDSLDIKSVFDYDLESRFDYNFTSESVLEKYFN